MGFVKRNHRQKKTTSKLARQEPPPMSTARHTSTRQRKNTEKDVGALPHLARNLSYTLRKSGFRLESIAEWAHCRPQPRLPGGHHQLR